VAVTADDGTNVVRANRLATHLAAMQALTNKIALAVAGIGTCIVTAALQDLAVVLFPTKILQRVKRCLRREARKPVDMPARFYLLHVIRINMQEIPRLPPNFNCTQILSDDEVVDILLFGAPKSWQREMDCQGLDPLSSAPKDAAALMERIKMSEDFNGDSKVAAVSKKANNKNKSNTKGNSGADGSKHCTLHGNNNAHNTSECKTLMAQAKMLKGNNGGNQKGEGGNKSWKNKAKDNTNDSKKELAALIKKATEAIKQGELNAIEPVKKRKVKWPSNKEEELCALDAELKNFNYEDLDKMDLKGESDVEKEDGELDISMLEEISDGVTV